MVNPADRDGFYRTDRLDYIFRYRRNHTIADLLRLYINWMPSVPCTVRLLRKDGVPYVLTDGKFVLRDFTILSERCGEERLDMENGNICIFTGSNMAVNPRP